MILDQYGKPFRTESRDTVDRRELTRLAAAYDVAVGKRNVEHWAMADGLSAAAANSYSIRKNIREKSRYEYCNNSFAKGIAWTLATDLVGTRVRIQFHTGDRRWDRFAESAVMRWMKATKLSKKLRTGRIARSVDGEAFFMKVYSPRMRGSRVKVGVRLVECDHFDDPEHYDTNQRISGITIDPRDSEPISYTMMKHHPGSNFLDWNAETQTLSERDVFHWFRPERGGQIRGISETCQSLTMYAQLRRWTLATLDAAETAASIAGMLETQAMPLDDMGLPDYDSDVEAFDTIAIEHGMMMTAPRGHKFSQIKAEHPTSTYNEFRNAIVNEAGRGEMLPANKARGDSSGYNYASGRLDHQTYYEYQNAERCDLSDDGLDKFLEWYFTEGRLIYPEFADVDLDELPEHTWYFDGHPHSDETKHASATTMMVDAELLAEDDYLISQGKDPEQHHAKILQQRKRKAELAKIFDPEAAKAASQNDPSGKPEKDGPNKDESDADDPDDEETDTEE